MTRRTRTLIGAAIGCLLIAGLVLIAVLSAGRSREGKAYLREKTEKILPFDARQLVRLEIDIEGRKCVLQRSAAGWRLMQPVADDVDGASLAALLGALAKLTAGTESGAASDYGLSPPRARISLLSSSGEKLALLVGARGKFPDLLYLQKEGRPEALYVAGEFEKVLLQNSFDLRRKRLLLFEPRLLTNLVLKTAGNVIEFQKRGQRWLMLRPDRGPANQAAVGRIVTTLHALRAVAFPDERQTPRSAFGLDPAEITAKLYGPDERSLVEVALGSVHDHTDRTRFYARCITPPGPLAEIREYQFRNLSQAPAALLDRAKTE
ncbi:MAG TPA: DUF4340 domain-containing protein [Myxococcota bacterium]|nr:DUF4340 domain-containing protein [Myxococcota bacterium]